MFADVGLLIGLGCLLWCADVLCSPAGRYAPGAAGLMRGIAIVAGIIALVLMADVLLTGLVKAPG